MDEAPSLESAIDHLEFLGYRAQKDDTGVNLTHDKKPFVRIYSDKGSDRVIFLVPFNIGSGARTDPQGFTEFLNRVNNRTALCKFYVNKDRLFVQSLYSGPYEKSSFGSFFDAFLEEVWAPREFPSDVEKFLT